MTFIGMFREIEESSNQPSVEAVCPVCKKVLVFDDPVSTILCGHDGEINDVDKMTEVKRPNS